jgi:hypothetical protein
MAKRKKEKWAVARIEELEDRAVPAVIVWADTGIPADVTQDPATGVVVNVGGMYTVSSGVTVTFVAGGTVTGTDGQVTIVLGAALVAATVNGDWDFAPTVGNLTVTRIDGATSGNVTIAGGIIPLVGDNITVMGNDTIDFGGEATAGSLAAAGSKGANGNVTAAVGDGTVSRYLAATSAPRPDKLITVQALRDAGTPRKGDARRRSTTKHPSAAHLRDRTPLSLPVTGGARRSHPFAPSPSYVRERSDSPAEITPLGGVARGGRRVGPFRPALGETYVEEAVTRTQGCRS